MKTELTLKRKPPAAGRLSLSLDIGGCRPGERWGDEAGLARRQEDARLVVADQLARRAFVDGEDAAAGRHRLQQRVADVGELVQGEEDIGGPEVAPHLWLRHGADEAHAVADAQAPRLRLQIRPLLAVADDEEARRDAAVA